MVKIFCAIVGEPRSVTDVEITDATSVSLLPRDIKTLFPITLKDIEPAKLQLFLAKKDGKWLQSCSEDMEKLMKGEKTATIEELIHEDKELDPTKLLGGLFERAPTNDVLHALVVLLYAVKRQRLEEKTSMAKLWKRSKLELETFPTLHQLISLLKRPLPFRLTLRDPAIAKDTFDINSPLLSCPELETTMNYFLDQCQRKFHPETKASEGSWQKYYDILLSLTANLYREESYGVLTCRNPAEGTTLPPLRPNFVLQRNCVVLMRGEEHSSMATMATSVGKLMRKMKGWSVILYADLPYILGYATSGAKIQFVAIEKSDGWCTCSPTPILSCNIFMEEALTLKVFYNLAFLLHQMGRLAHRSVSFGLLPFCPNDNGKRKIEMLDNAIERTITRNHRISTEDLDRLAKIYRTLETLNEEKGSSETHLQSGEPEGDD